MPSQVLSTTENNFTKGLVTEFTGLNFPENAATDADNCTFTLVSDVVRRQGINLETNFLTSSIDRTGLAMNSYRWNNVGGLGEQQFLVTQTGGTLYFWDVDAATIASPLSNQRSSNTIDVSAYIPIGGTFDTTKECQFSDGNGYLFVYHPSIDPIYITFNPSDSSLVANIISLQIRDFTGVIDSLPVSVRPAIQTDDHSYNLQNQGWTSGSAWHATSTPSQSIYSGNAYDFTVAAGIVGITLGQIVSVFGQQFFGLHSEVYNYGTFSGTVISYAGTTLRINIFSGAMAQNLALMNFSISPISTGYINTWFTAEGNYPSNSDVWWYFKNNTGIFDPATTQPSVQLSTGNAPRGHYLLNPFNQDRVTASGIASITNVSTTARPTNGAWFQGRVWYTGVNASQVPLGDANFYTWTENIYFSQIVQGVSDFGSCFQTNDPTSEQLFDLLPTDGGVITIQGSGNIYKLFPIQNGMLVFASNGIWFITGSQGIGFSANDYTITKISAIKNFSSSSYVDVQGLPYFWNEDGIYAVQPIQGGGLGVNSLTFTTIDSYYNAIPLSAKKFARGDYDPINYVIKWIFKDTEETSVTDRYAFNKMLNFSTANKAFYPYTVDIVTASINTINYISGPGGSTCPPPIFKHIATFGTSMSIADEHDTNYVDWHSVADVAYESTFTTGYKLHGQAQRRFQMPYVYVYSRVDGGSVAYKVQGIWDYATSGNTGRYSTAQIYNISGTNYAVVQKRTRIRGMGLSLQIKFKSVSGQPFDFIGWSTFETANQGV